MFLESMKVALDLRNKDTEKNNFYNIKYINPEIRTKENIYSISISDEDEFKTVLDSNANNLKKLGENIVNGLIPICPFMQNKNSTKIQLALTVLILIYVKRTLRKLISENLLKKLIY